jgi:hypothetical protein
MLEAQIKIYIRAGLDITLLDSMQYESSSHILHK